MIFAGFLLRLCERTLDLISKLTGLILTYDVVQLNSGVKISNFNGSKYLLRKFHGSSAQRDHFPLDLLNPYGNQIAIILQGSVSSNLELTQRAILHYRDTFPDAHVIVSTWYGEELNCLRWDQKTHYVQTIKPSDPGHGNVNLQIASTKAGLAFAESLGVKYVIKSRTDQVLSSPTLFLTLKAKIEENLPQKTVPKIVVSSLNTFLFRPYSISDMFQFSTLENIKFFWNVHEQDASINFPTKIDSNLDWAAKELSEVYLTVNYLRNLGCEIEFTLDSYFKNITQYFSVIDQATISQIWTKYTLLSDRRAVSYFPSRYTELSTIYFEIIKKDLSLFNDWKQIAECQEIL